MRGRREYRVWEVQGDGEEEEGVQGEGEEGKYKVRRRGSTR